MVGVRVRVGVKSPLQLEFGCVCMHLPLLLPLIPRGWPGLEWWLSRLVLRLVLGPWTSQPLPSEPADSGPRSGEHQIINSIQKTSSGAESAARSGGRLLFLSLYLARWMAVPRCISQDTAIWWRTYVSKLLSAWSLPNHPCAYFMIYVSNKIRL